MALGFALNEALAAATAVSGALAWAWWWRRRRNAQSPKPWWVSWGAELFTVIALVFGCRVALADWMHVPSGSMEPTLQVGDVLLINHLAYGPRLPFTNTTSPFLSWGLSQSISGPISSKCAALLPSFFAATSYPPLLRGTRSSSSANMTGSGDC